jgi:hypothetical protein
MRTAFNRRFGDVPVWAFSLMLIASFLAVFGIATALGAVAQDREAGVGHTGGPVTPRVVVASGKSAEYGRWELLRSADANGGECLALQLYDQGPGPVKDDPLYEGCGGPSELNVAILTGTNGRSMVYGRAPADAANVQITASNKATRTITPGSAPAESSRLARSASTGTARSFFVASYSGTVEGVEVRALDGRGSVMSAQTAP